MWNVNNFFVAAFEYVECSRTPTSCVFSQFVAFFLKKIWSECLDLLCQSRPRSCFTQVLISCIACYFRNAYKGVDSRTYSIEQASNTQDKIKFIPGKSPSLSAYSQNLLSTSTYLRL